MTLLFYRHSMAAAIAMTVLGGLVSPCSGGVLDWLFPGRAYRQAYYYPGVYGTYYGAYPGGVYPGTTAYYGGYGSGGLGYNGYGTAAYGSSWPVGANTAGYTPYSAYRTSYAAIPVTSFRPVTSGVTTYMQPCSGYEWQAQRVPYAALLPTTYPAVGSAAPACAAAPTCSSCTTAAYTAAYGSYTDPQSTVVSDWQPVQSCGYGATAPCATDGCASSQCSALGGYATGAAFSPSTPGCSSCAGAGQAEVPYSSQPSSEGGVTAGPWESVTPPGTAPGSSGSVPADSRPSLEPQTQETGYAPQTFGSQQNAEPASASRPGWGSSPATMVDWRPVAGSASPGRADDPWSNPTWSPVPRLRPDMPTTSPSLQSRPSLAPPQRPTLDSGARSTPPVSIPYHQAIPDPMHTPSRSGDSSGRTPRTNDSLLDHEEVHTAWRPPVRFEAVPIQWGTNRSLARERDESNRIQPVSWQRDEDESDPAFEGNWRSVAPEPQR